MQLIKIVAISSCLVTLHMNVSPATASSAENGRKRARLDVATACAISSGNPFQEIADQLAEDYRRANPLRLLPCEQARAACLTQIIETEGWNLRHLIENELTTSSGEVCSVERDNILCWFLGVPPSCPMHLIAQIIQHLLNAYYRVQIGLPPGACLQPWEEVSMYRSISCEHYTDFSRQIPLHEKNEVAKTITHTFISLFHGIAKAHLASVRDYEDEDTSDLENSSVCSGCKTPSEQGD